MTTVPVPVVTIAVMSFPKVSNNRIYFVANKHKDIQKLWCLCEHFVSPMT